MYKSNHSGLQMALDVAETHGIMSTTRMNCLVLRNAQTWSEVLSWQLCCPQWNFLHPRLPQDLSHLPFATWYISFGVNFNYPLSIFCLLYFFPGCSHQAVTRSEINDRPLFIYSFLKKSIFSWTVLSLLALLVRILWKAAAVFQEPSSRYYVIFFQGDSWGRAAVRLLQLGWGFIDVALEEE